MAFHLILEYKDYLLNYSIYFHCSFTDCFKSKLVVNILVTFLSLGSTYCCCFVQMDFLLKISISSLHDYIIIFIDSSQFRIAAEIRLLEDPLFYFKMNSYLAQ